MRDKGISYEVYRYDADMQRDRDSPAVMWAIAIGTPLCAIAGGYGVMWLVRWFL